MDVRVYGVVAVVPGIVFSFLAAMILLVMNKKCPDKLIYIATSTFNKVLYYSVEEKKKKLYFLEHRITDRALAEKLSIRMSLLFFGLLAATMSVFSSFLLLDISFECQEGFDCYKYMIFDIDYDPVNCEVARNGSAHVICYRFTFNLFLATGVGYGVLKVSLVVVYLFSILFLHIHKNSPNSKRIMCALRMVGGLLFVTVLTLGILDTRYAVVSAADAIRYGFTFITVLLVFMCLNCMVPWAQLAKLEQPVEDFTDDVTAYIGVRTPKYTDEIVSKSKQVERTRRASRASRANKKRRMHLLAQADENNVIA